MILISLTSLLLLARVFGLEPDVSSPPPDTECRRSDLRRIGVVPKHVAYINTTDVEIRYTKDSTPEDQYKVQCGNEIPMDVCSNKPKISFGLMPCPCSKASILLLNIDRNRKGYAPYLQWMIINLPASKLAIGDLSDAKEPHDYAPPQETYGDHYVFLLYCQKVELDFVNNALVNRNCFDIDFFQYMNELDAPLAANFFTLPWPDSQAGTKNFTPGVCPYIS